MTIQPTLYGVVRPEAMRTGTETKPENLKRISAGDLEAIPNQYSREHWTRKYKTVRDSETIQHGTKAGDLAPIRKGKAAEKRKL